ncbi:MAG: mechanosensitive ion channel protein MscS, partial [Nitrosospira sp.]
TFITSTVVNQTYSNHRLRLLFPIQVGYASPVEVAMNIMLEAAKKRQQILVRPERVIYLKEFADSGSIWR